MKKGDRVEWMDKGKMAFGVVRKGGKNIHVFKDGGELSVSGHSSLFTPSNEPLPNAGEANPMSAYTVKGFKEIRGHGDSRTFFAKIYKDGKAILSVENDGWGGNNLYHNLKKGEHHFKSKEMDEFLAATKEWAKAATGIEHGEYSETEDLWLEWEVFERPYGQTAASSLEWLKEMLPAMRHGT